MHDINDGASLVLEADGPAASDSFADQCGEYRQTGWKPYPKALLDDQRLRAHHHSIALAVLSLTSIHSDPATQHEPVRTAPGLTSRTVGRLAGCSVGNAGTYLAQLEEFGHLTLQRAGRKIIGINWNDQHVEALRWDRPFIRVPMPILCDYSLPPKLKHTYVALRWAQYRYGNGSEFHISARTLGGLMGRSRNTARDLLRELQRLGLVEPGSGSLRNQMRPLRFVPLEVRYVRIDARGKRLHGGIPTHLPLIDSHPRYELFVQNRGRIEELVWPLGEPAPPSVRVVKEPYWADVLSTSNPAADPSEPTWRSTPSKTEIDPVNFQADPHNLQVDPKIDVLEGVEEVRSLNSPRRARMNEQGQTSHPRPKTAAELVSHLQRKLSDQHARLDEPSWHPEVNPGAVGSQLGQMLQEGVDPAVIEEMIDIFTSSEVYHRPGIPPWKTFLGSRHTLKDKARRAAQARRAVTEGSEYWTGLPQGRGGLSGVRRRV